MCVLFFAKLYRQSRLALKRSVNILHRTVVVCDKQSSRQRVSDVWCSRCSPLKCAFFRYELKL